jgi:hypothetical protein
MPDKCLMLAMLLPVQTQHQTFHDKIVGSADVFFLRGKIAFDRPGLPQSIAPFANMLVIFGADQAMIARMLANFDCVHLPRGAARRRW